MDLIKSTKICPIGKPKVMKKIMNRKQAFKKFFIGNNKKTFRNGFDAN